MTNTQFAMIAVPLLVLICIVVYKALLAPRRQRVLEARQTERMRAVADQPDAGGEEPTNAEPVLTERVRKDNQFRLGVLLLLTITPVIMIGLGLLIDSHVRDGNAIAQQTYDHLTGGGKKSTANASQSLVTVNATNVTPPGGPVIVPEFDCTKSCKGTGDYIYVHNPLTDSPKLVVQCNGADSFNCKMKCYNDPPPGVTPAQQGLINSSGPCRAKKCNEGECS